VPVDFVPRALDHIAHQPESELSGDTFHLLDPKPISMGETVNELAKAAGAPQLAMRIDANLSNIVPAPVMAGIQSLPTVKAIRAQVLSDLDIPPQVLEHRDFKCDFDTRDAQRALRGSGIAVPPLSSYAGRLWDYWERNLDPDLFRERSLTLTVTDKRVVVTGASSGIGRELSLKLGEAGAEVGLVSRTRERLEEVASEISERGGSAHVRPADLSDLEDIDRLAQELLSEHDGIDILVNNAGRSIRRSVAASYDRTMRLNYFGALKLILALLPGMRERKTGHIVNVSSIGVQTNTPRFSAYVASKSALDAFSRCIAPEVVSDNVKITTVYMPLVKTPMIAPTNIYDAFPTLAPDEAAQMICDALMDKPKRMATRLGTFGEILYAVSPEDGRPGAQHRLQDLPGLKGREGGGRQGGLHGRRRVGRRRDVERGHRHGLPDAGRALLGLAGDWLTRSRRYPLARRQAPWSRGDAARRVLALLGVRLYSRRGRRARSLAPAQIGSETSMSWS